MLHYKNILCLLFLFFGSLLLTACGGGGGGSPSNASGGNVQATAPVISGKAAAFVRASQSYDFKPTASGANNITLTYSVKNPPAWAQFNKQTGELSGNPSKVDIGEYDNIIISVTDGTKSASLAPFSIEVINPPLNKQSIDTSNATVTQTNTGFDAQGDVTVTSGGMTTDLANANLHFEFDAGDNLKNITGTALLPKSISS